MGIVFWLAMVFVLVLGMGYWLLLPGLRNLARRAKTLNMWPDRRDEPPYPWTLWPEWTFALLCDLFRRSAQRDSEYHEHQRRVRWGAVLIVVGFASIALLAKLSDN